jgi:DNA-binding NtrC family response regulator
VNIVWQPGITLDSIERDVIEKAMRFHEGNRQFTADSLGISIRTLQNKLKLYKEQDDEPRAEQPVKAAIRL